MIYRGLPRDETSWLEISYNSFKLETWKGKTFKIETSQSPKYSERKYCFLPLSFDGVCRTCARCWWWWLWWWQLISESVLSLLCGAWPGAPLPRSGKHATLAESCEKHRKNFEELRNLSCVLERTSSALLVSKNKDCLCCAGLPRPKQAPVESTVLSDYIFLRSSFLKIPDYFFALLMLFMMNDDWVASGFMTTILERK